MSYYFVGLCLAKLRNEFWWFLYTTCGRQIEFTSCRFTIRKTPLSLPERSLILKTIFFFRVSLIKKKTEKNPQMFRCFVSVFRCFVSLFRGLVMSGQYPAILISHLVINPYILIDTWFVYRAGPRWFEPVYFEFPVISNSKPFPLDVTYSHLLSCILNYFLFPKQFEMCVFFWEGHNPLGGGYSVNLWIVVCHWDTDNLTLYVLSHHQLEYATLF